MIRRTVIPVLVEIPVVLACYLAFLLYPEFTQGADRELWLSVMFATMLAVPLGAGIMILVRSRGHYAELGRWLSGAAGGECGDIPCSWLKSVPELGELAESVPAVHGEIRQVRDELSSERKRADRSFKMVEQVRRKAESARCSGLLSAARTLDHAAGGISEECASLGGYSDRAREGAESQLEYLGSVVASIEQMNTSVDDSARNADEAAQDARTAVEQAEDGEKVVEKTIEAISRVSQSSEDLNGLVTGLGSHADSIGSIIGVISDIADQTNLLALNAAIEAARAGEAGKGFAVVADEVRKLAEKTMEATKDVGVAIESIQTEVRKTVDGVSGISGLAGDAAELSAESGRALNSIVNLAGKSAERITMIAAQAEQQSAASREVSEAVSRVHDISDSTGEAMNGASGALEGLGGRISELETMIGVFRLVGEGKVQEVIDFLSRSKDVLSRDRELQEKAMRRALRNHDFLELLYITDDRGIQTVSNISGSMHNYAENESAYGTDWSDREWYKGAVENQTLYISDVYRSSASGENCITVSSPFRDAEGRILGVIAADVRISAG